MVKVDIAIDKGENISISKVINYEDIILKKYRYVYPYIKNIVSNEIDINCKILRNKLKNIPKMLGFINKINGAILYFDKINGIQFSNLNVDSLSLKERFNIFNKLLVIVKSLHDIKIIHNDIKSTNIMITSDKEVYLIDFDLSTSLYKNNFNVDIYSLNKILYFLLKDEKVILRLRNYTYDSIDEYIKKIGEIENELLFKNRT